MIFGHLTNFECHPRSQPWKIILDFLNSISPAVEDGRYSLQGDDIFALVMSYQTKDPAQAILESHRKYVDIQAVLKGAEGCECFSADTLTVSAVYDPDKDAIFYHRSAPGPVHIALSPGAFVAFFPQDGHMPCLTLGDQPQTVKKVVVKARADLLLDDFAGARDGESSVD